MTDTNHSKQADAIPALDVPAGSAGFCMCCEHWELRDSMQELGYVPSSAIGYCPIFDKLTDARYGIHCTAFSPNAVNHARSPNYENTK